MPNFSSSLFKSKSSVDHTNPFSTLIQDGNSALGSQSPPCSIQSPDEFHQSTPKSGQISRKEIHHRLRLLNVNCRSVVNKKEQFHALIDNVKPDIIIGTESWLKPDMLDNEIFPSDFTVYCKDRISAIGGGVFAAVSDNVLSVRLEDLESE